MDVHQDSIVLAGVSVQGSDRLFEIRLPNDHAVFMRHMKRLNKRHNLRCCYEASSCGYVVYRWLNKSGIACDIIAPSLIPHKPGDRIKTDKRDALNLALLYRAGLLARVHIPDENEQGVRSLVRGRETLHREVVRSRQYILKFLQQRGLVFREGSNWTLKHWKYLRDLSFSGSEESIYRLYLELLEYKLTQLNELDRKIEEASLSRPYSDRVKILRCFRGIDTLTAMVLQTEVVDFSRFAGAELLMSYFGLVPSQHSSGDAVRTGSITKAGNNRCRRILIESSWHYQHKPSIGQRLKKCQKGQPAHVIAVSWKAQCRLYRKFWKIANRKDKNKAVVAVARELTGFIWSVMH